MLLPPERLLHLLVNYYKLEHIIVHQAMVLVPSIVHQRCCTKKQQFVAHQPQQPPLSPLLSLFLAFLATFCVFVFYGRQVILILLQSFLN